MKHISSSSITLLILLASLAASRLYAQHEPPVADTLIEQSLRIVDLPRFEWEGAPDPMRPRLGVYVFSIPADSFKLIAGFPKDVAIANRVWHTMPHWSADEGGILIGDVLLAMNGGPLADSLYAYDEFLNMRVREMRPGDTVRFTILRDGAVREIRFPLLAAKRVSMSYYQSSFDKASGGRAGMFGGTRSETWLQRTLQEKSLLERARTIQKQLRIVADQDFSTVDFAGSPNPWRLDDITYLHNHPTRTGVLSRSISNQLWEWSGGTKVEGAVRAAALRLDHPRAITADDAMVISSLKELTTQLDRVQGELDIAYAPIRGELDSIVPRLMRMLDMENNWEGEIDSVKGALARRELRNREEEKLKTLFGAADKVEMEPLLNAGAVAARLADSAWLAGFAKRIESEEKRKPARVPGVDGEIITSWETPHGRCVIGGKGPNRYTGSFRLIIDLGGDDVYDIDELRPGKLRFVADVAGNDIYNSNGSGQGAGIGGVDILTDLAGNDIYRGARYSQGAGLLGVGVLADYAGSDIYTSRWCSQGAAFHGIGILFDGGGDDSYTADIYSQGFGYIRGFGAIMERGGNDSYRAGWKYADTRIPHEAYLAMSQGFGFGMRPWSTGIGSDGGIGIISDRRGDDLYASDFFSQGGSYWYALGILHDAEGTDRYTAGQYSQGSGIHLSFGALLDDGGDDTYDAYAGLEQGNAHDWSAGCLEDRSGNDTYRGSSSSQGSALNVSIAWLLDGGGNDSYYAQLTDSTHSQGGGNVNRTRQSGALGLLIDLGAGSDYYVEPRALPGYPVVKGNGLLFDDGPAAKESRR